MVTRERLKDFVGIITHAKEIRWSQRVGLITEVLCSAGFVVSLRQIQVGRLNGHQRDQDGYCVGEADPLNPTSGLNVEGNDRATLWLEAIWSEVVRRSAAEAPLAVLLDWLADEIVRSQPLVPIVLTQYGEAMGENPPPGFGRVDHTKDSKSLGSTPGVHQVCRGYIDLKPVATGYNALVCRQCQLRVVIPNTITTYVELRNHFRNLRQ